MIMVMYDKHLSHRYFYVIKENVSGLTHKHILYSLILKFSEDFNI